MVKNFNEYIKILEEKINKANTIAIASHMNPDGDNLGSKLCLYKLFKNLNKEVYVIENDQVPTAEKFLPGVEHLVDSDTLEDKKIDLMIVTDCGDIERIGRAESIFKKADFTVNIDHHETNVEFADLNLVDMKAPAVCEFLYLILKQMNFSIDKDMATCLYTGISTDTGSFKYDSIRPLTFEVAIELLKIGIDINKITVNLYQRRSKEKTELLIRALNNIRYYENNKIGLVSINEKDIFETGARKSDSDGIVEFVRDIDGIELSIFINEKKDYYKLSTRSKTYVDCTKIAKVFGGGGHIRAAGATLYKKDYPNLCDAINRIIDLSSNEIWYGWNFIN